jgi:hypothetical protein
MTRSIGTRARAKDMRVTQTTCLFVYGTLMAEEVLTPLIGRVPTQRVATILGFSRGCVRGEAFPAVLRSGPDDRVEGVLIEDLLPRELRALDYYVSDRHSNLREPPACRPAHPTNLRRTRAMSASASQSPPLTAIAWRRCATCGRRSGAARWSLRGRGRTKASARRCSRSSCGTSSCRAPPRLRRWSGGGVVSRTVRFKGCCCC